MSTPRNNWWLAGGLAGLAVVGMVVLMLTLRLWLSDKLLQRPELVLPLFAVLGVIALFATLSIVAVAFAAVNLTDKSHALGLPEGSVRAAIALSLIVIFVISAVFLYGDLSKSQLEILPRVSQTGLDAIPPALVVSQSANQDGTFAVVIRNEKSQAAQNFAQQMLTGLITLVTAVASFYFGTRAIETARGTPERPSLRILTPPSDPPPELRAEANASLVITVVASPRGEAVVWDRPMGDVGGELVQVSPEKFEYRRGPTPSDLVVLRFRLANHPELSTDLVVRKAAATEPPAA